MIDCARNSNFGCDGGDICSLLMWLSTSKTAILPERNYPLTRTTDECRLPRSAQLKLTNAIHNFFFLFFLLEKVPFFSCTNSSLMWISK